MYLLSGKGGGRGSDLMKNKIKYKDRQNKYIKNSNSIHDELKLFLNLRLNMNSKSVNNVDKNYQI